MATREVPSRLFLEVAYGAPRRVRVECLSRPDMSTPHLKRGIEIVKKKRKRTKQTTKAAATNSGWDFPLRTFTYPGFEYGSFAPTPLKQTPLICRWSTFGSVRVPLGLLPELNNSNQLHKVPVTETCFNIRGPCMSLRSKRGPSLASLREWMGLKNVIFVGFTTEIVFPKIAKSRN